MKQRILPAARAGEAENPANDIGRAGGNVGDHGALAAAGGPARCRAGPGEIALAGLKNDTDLMHARRNASGRRGRAPARSGEAARCSGEGEVRGIRNGSNRKGAVVSRDTDAAGGHELTDDKTVRRDGLNRRGCGGRGASSRSGKSRSARNVGELRGGRCGDYGERAVVAGDADSRDGHGLARGKAVRGCRGDGDEETVFGGAVGARGNGDRSGLRCAVRTRGDRNKDIFIHGRGPRAGPALADAVEIRVIELAWQVVAGFSVADGQIFPAEKRGGIRVGIRGEAGSDARERSRRGLFVEHAVRVERHCAQRGVQRFVGLEVVDRGIARQRPEKRLQAGTRRHPAVAENNVLAIGRHAMRQVRGRHVGHQAAEDLDGCVE